jgi:two-component system phosphate regulon sensor histidine kinase PhoR
MTQFRSPRPTLSSHLTAIVCLGLGFAWVIDPLISAQGVFARLTLVLGGLGLGLAALRLVSLWYEQSAKVAQQCVERLTSVTHHELALETPESLPHLARGNPWCGFVATIAARLADDAARISGEETTREENQVRLRRLTAERDQQREIFLAIADPVLVVDAAGKLQLANVAARELFGLGEESPVEVRDIVGRELADALADVGKRKGGAPRNLEISRELEGRNCTFRVACRCLSAGPGDDSATRRMLAVFSDISALKVIQKRNADFVSAASHEMRTPLASIKAYTELLSDGAAEDEQTRDEFLEVIRGQTERLQRLIDNLLNLARIEAGVVEVQKTPRSLNELLTEAVDVMRPAAEQKSLTLQVELSPLYLGVLADRDTLLQAAINLMSNAIKYTRAGSVTLRSRLVGEEVAFEVADSGVGLSPEDCQKVFQKFYRVKKDKDMAAGTGLGLPLVKHIVEDVHGGRMEVESELGQGSTFRVVLPAVGQLTDGG